MRHSKPRHDRDSFASRLAHARGVALLTPAMLAISPCRRFGKYLSVNYSPLFLSWARYAIASPMVLPIATAIVSIPALPQAAARGAVSAQAVAGNRDDPLFFCPVADPAGDGGKRLSLARLAASLPCCWGSA